MLAYKCYTGKKKHAVVLTALFCHSVFLAVAVFFVMLITVVNDVVSFAGIWCCPSKTLY